MKRNTYWILSMAMVLSVAHAECRASFHFMQIEQVIGGVNGDSTLQAIQLRMRFFGQNFVSFSRLRVWDASGNNPVIVKNFLTNVTNGAAGARVLIVSADFAAELDSPVMPDFIMDNLIPASYLAGGSLTFEDNTGTIIYWRLSWGSYSGPTTGHFTNDPNSDFGSPFPGAMPSSDVNAIQFQGLANATSTTNLADYALTSGGSTWTNNAGAGGALIGGIGPDPCPSDIDNNNSVDVLDLLSLLAQWGDDCSIAACTADIDNDDEVAVLDLLQLLADWGACP